MLSIKFQSYLYRKRSVRPFPIQLKARGRYRGTSRAFRDSNVRLSGSPRGYHSYGDSSSGSDDAGRRPVAVTEVPELCNTIEEEEDEDCLCRLARPTFANLCSMRATFSLSLRFVAMALSEVKHVSVPNPLHNQKHATLFCYASVISFAVPSPAMSSPRRLFIDDRSGRVSLSSSSSLESKKSIALIRFGGFAVLSIS